MVRNSPYLYDDLVSHIRSSILLLQTRSFTVFMSVVNASRPSMMFQLGKDADSPSKEL